MINISIEKREKYIYPIWNIFAKSFPVMATKIKYRIVTGTKLNLKKPRTMNEKMQWLKLNTYRNNSLVEKCCDKYRVHEYVVECGCGEILNELYGKWDKVEDIDWNSLPSSFVIKCNHGSGQNIICRDKREFNIEDAVSKLQKWMEEPYGVTNVELIYNNIPRCIIAEKYIETEDGLPPKDYKVFCSYGEPKLLFVASERNGDFAKFDYYTTNWEWIPVTNNHPNGEIMDKPIFLEQILDYARKLSKPFPIVRVDFYYENGRVIFGELTFLHFGGSAPFDPPEYDYIFGELFNIEQELEMRKGKLLLSH